ncbi:hypothetical protein [Kitasatospora griseola]|uniref:hypothetical protein n=1 Tax=Kitasatospora griseola TaxID=2064 RepID=UPI0016713B16|nr:hypothetical protein [Kitasatospora griseola]GGR03464.1 hypothetical protein GCM10010195_68840 [Kitasatospora griseola]
MSEVQKILLSNVVDEYDTTSAESTRPEDIAWRRGSLAYAYAGLLTAKAILRAQPALVAVTHRRISPASAPWPHRTAYFKSLSSSREVLEEAVWKLKEVAADLTGPAPDFLALTGEQAIVLTRSAALSQRPAKPVTSRTAAGPGAAVQVSPPAVRAATARSGTRR